MLRRVVDLTRASPTDMNFYDAHNHLQDERFGGRSAELLAACAQAGVKRMVVNGACESDWPQVLALAKANPLVLPSFGYHPWYLHEATPDWRKNLEQQLDAVPSAVGEIGLDRWIKDHNFAQQEEVFTWQLRLAAERELAVSIHCLEAWGPLLAILKSEPRPRRGFLLHSYGGAAEMIPAFAKLGAYFSLPGYFANERKARRRETFRHVPPERLLIETDAPDQPLPDARNRFPLVDAEGKPVNHPANLRAVYEFAAELLGLPPEELEAEVEANFLRLFA